MRDVRLCYIKLGHASSFSQKDSTSKHLTINLLHKMAPQQPTAQLYSMPEGTASETTGMSRSFVANSPPIVISGIGGRYPESESMDEFARNLFMKVDMINDEERRWPSHLYDMNQRMGKLKNIEKFDGAFFGWRKRLGDWIDPHARILLETTYEAIADAGVNPQTLRGSKTGVYVGYSTIGMPDGLPQLPDNTSRTSLTDGMSWIQGSSKSMYANRLSYYFDFHGPSICLDTACSSSMVALDLAVTDLRVGKIDQAIVAGTNINLQAFTNYFYQKLGFNARDGLSKVWDKDADGFVRSETVASFFLQYQAKAKRVYARIIHTRTNMDGYKDTGMFFPSSEGQLDLLQTTYREAQVNPNDVTYFEAHGTGTKVGDFQEASAIHRTFCTSGRTEPLPIGLLKSNIGHGEAASGVASMTKVIIAFENECIPANLNLNEVKGNLRELKLLQPVVDNLKYTPGIAGVSSFGVGGVNGHTVLEPNWRVAGDSGPIATPELPRLVPLHGRTKEGVEHLMNFIETNPKKVTPEFLALIADVFMYEPMLLSAGFPHRGTLLITNDGQSADFKYSRSEIDFINTQYRGRLCFFYSGIGGQSTALAKEFMSLERFSSKLQLLATILAPHGVNLVELLTSESAEATIRNSLTAKFVSTTAFQIIWTDIFLNDLKLSPDVIIGHSFGEISAAYAQGYITAEEALLISFNRGRVLEEARKEIPVGLMAAVGISATEATERLPKNVYLACNNAPKLVTLSGEETAMKHFLAKLSAEGIFVRELDSSQYPLHTPFLEVVKDRLLTRLQAVFAQTRSKKATPVQLVDSLKWISTCQTVEVMEEMHSRHGEEQFYTRLAQYFIDNLLKPVNFNGALSRLTDDAILLEFAGRELFEKVTSAAKSSLRYLPLLRAKARNVDGLLATCAALFQLGFNVFVQSLYPAVKWPVPRGTQSLASLLKWDHHEDYMVKKHPEHFFKPTAGDLVIEVDPEMPDCDYMYHHVIEGRIIVPGAAYLVYAWKQFADFKGLPWKKVPVQFEDVHIKRPIFLDRNSKTKVTVRLLDPSGEFTILEGTQVCATGLIKELKPDSLANQEVLNKYDEQVVNMVTMDKEDIYKDYRIRGYDYGPKFQCIVNYSSDMSVHSFARIQWTGHMIAFLDNLLQLTGPTSPLRDTLTLPTMVQLARIDPAVLFKEIELNSISSTEVKPDEELEEFFENDPTNQNASEEVFEEIRSKLSKITDEADQTKNANAVIHAYIHMPTQTIVAPGVEISGLGGAFVPRKIHPLPVTVESHEFVANCEGAVLEADREEQLRQYESICLAECARLLAHFKLDLKQLVAQSGGELPEQSTVDRFTKEGSALLKMLSSSLAELDSNNQQQALCRADSTEQHRLESLSTLLAANALKLYNSTLTDTEASLRRRYILEYFHSDLISSLAHEERLIRPLIDLVAENFSLIKELSVLHLSPVSTYLLASAVDKYLTTSTIFKLNVDFTLAQPLASESPAECPSSFSHAKWSLEQLWPESLELKSEPQLIVIYDDPLLLELPLAQKAFWAKLATSVVDGGFVLVLLRSQLTPLERFVSEITFNEKLATDEELQQRSKATLREAAGAGFFSVASKSTSFGQQAILFRRKKAASEAAPKHTTLTFETNQDTWLQAVQGKLKQAAEGSEEIVWLLADGQTLPGALGFFNCLCKEPGGRQFRLFFLPDGAKGSAVEQFKRHCAELIKLDLAVNILKAGRIGTYRHLTRDLLNGTRLTTEYHLNMGPQRTDIGNLTFYESTNLCQLRAIPRVGALPRERKYAVYSTALLFRDVMFATGRVMPHMSMLAQNCFYGTEFAGRDWETGQRVFGAAIGGSIGTFVWERPDVVRPIPEHWSFDDAVGCFTSYITVWYGLIHKARLEEGSTVLIHSAAGGVGQAAINICKAYNCTIFATAGSEEKRNFICTNFQIPADHIFSSRDCKFEHSILALTYGAGVRYIVNSLIGEQVDASLRLLSDNGHFIELAKFEMQMNKRIGTRPFLRNITYHGVAIEKPMHQLPEIFNVFFDWLLSNCAPGQAVQPLSTHVFPIEDAVSAFRFMTTGKHKGKIVIRVREDDSKSSVKTIAPCKPLQVQTKTFLSYNKVYIVIGGCGGVGMELAHWLVKRGAARVVLTSRSKERTTYQTMVLGSLGAAGKVMPYFSNDIQVYSEDISTEAGMRQMLVDVAQQTGYPIGGIFHLAVSLNDCLLENMTSELWHRTVDSKATLALRLDKLTRELCPALDYFVCFSSVTAGRGNIGQSNYGYSNSVLERICEQRRRDGLHGLALQFGPIDDVGLLSNSEKTTFASVRLQGIISCLDVLNRAMRSDCTVVSSLVFADRSQQENKTGGNMVQSLWVALGVDPDTLPDHATLGELGMESMVAIEIQSIIEAELGVRLSLPEVKQITVGEMRNNTKDALFKQLQRMKDFRKYLASLDLKLPNAPTELVNAATEGELIFMLPSALGVFGPLRSLAEQINLPVVALNITRNVNENHVTVNQAAEYYSTLLRKKYPNTKRYNLIGVDYGALIALKMAHNGLPCRVVVLDKNQSLGAIRLDDEQLHDKLIKWVVNLLLAGAFDDKADIEMTQARLLRFVNKEAAFDSKVKTIAEEIQRSKENVKLEELEEMVGGALRRAQAMVEYGKEVAAKPETFFERLLDQLAKVQGKFLVVTHNDQLGMMVDLLPQIKVGEASSKEHNRPIDVRQVALSPSTSAALVNEFFS